MTMSQSALRIWNIVMIQSIFKPTPSCCARARPNSTWNPGGSAVLLAKGRELGWAHRPIEPMERIVSSDRAPTGPIRPMVATTASERMTFIFGVPNPNPLQVPEFVRRSLVGLQRADIFDDLRDLRVVERCAESRHRAFLAVLDAVDDEFVAALRIHELRPSAGAPASVGVAKPADRREQLLGIERRVVRRRGGLLRRGRDAVAQRRGQYCNRRQRHEGPAPPYPDRTHLGAH